MPTWIVEGKRPSVDWREFLTTNDEERAKAHLHRLRTGGFRGLTEYRIRRKDEDS